MTEILSEHHLLGLTIGVCTFLIIGLFHPITIKCNYYFGTRCWWWFLILGIAGLCGSFMTADVFWSSLLGVFSFSSFWTIGEIFEQEKRVARGWFPKNPARELKSPDRKKGRDYITAK